MGLQARFPIKITDGKLIALVSYTFRILFRLVQNPVGLIDLHLVHLFSWPSQEDCNRCSEKDLKPTQ